MPVRTAMMLAMPLLYLSAGIVLLSTDALAGTIVRHRSVIGGVLVAYGLLRSFLWWTKHHRRTVDHDAP